MSGGVGGGRSSRPPIPICAISFMNVLDIAREIGLYSVLYESIGPTYGGGPLPQPDHFTIYVTIHEGYRAYGNRFCRPGDPGVH